MKDHALIGKFMGLWPSEKALMLWVQTRWKFKGNMDVKLGSKGFFMVIFSCSADRSRIFDEGPYFFNSVGLHMRYWTERLSPEKEDFTSSLVWIRLYSLPQEFWHHETLAGIGDTLGCMSKHQR
jgi:hypothetical protein